MARILYIYILFISLNSICIAQIDSLSLAIHTLDREANFLQQAKINYSNKQSSRENIHQTLSQVQRMLWEKLYLEASIDSVTNIKNQYTAFLTIGKQYEHLALENGNIPTSILAAIGVSPSIFKQKKWTLHSINALKEKLLVHAENNGHPFASVYLDSLQIDNKGIIYAKIFINKFRYIYVEDIRVDGDVKISDSYLQNYLAIHYGDAYNQQNISDIKNKIRNLAFLQLQRETIVTFRGDAATIHLYLARKKASQFDFILGFLPQQNEQLKTKLIVTGALTANAQNILGLGEAMHVEFQQLRPQTQSLKLQLAYPYLLNLPFGVDGKLSLFRNDTTFFELDYTLGVQYLFNSRDYLKAFGGQRSTSLLAIDEAKIIENKQLPENLDVTFSGIGLEYQLERLDYRFNPRRGWEALLRGSAGFKKIDINNSIANLQSPNDPNFEFSRLYDTLELQSFQYQLEAKAAHYLKISKRGVLKSAWQGGAVLDKEPLQKNELYRLGGNKRLRGFDENAFTASLFSIATLEYRFIIASNSYLYTFVDYAYIENKYKQHTQYDAPLGLGAGMTFETRAGVFGISYALGKRRQESFDFKAAKIHFGYVSYF